jgi:uncharacterized protein YjiS (DUF1127 family)
VVQHRDHQPAEEPPVQIVSRSRSEFRRLCRALRERLRLWDARELERRFLCSLTEAQLRDMRLTAREAREEAAKPFWKA